MDVIHIDVGIFLQVRHGNSDLVWMDSLLSTHRSGSVVVMSLYLRRRNVEKVLGACFRHCEGILGSRCHLADVESRV